MYSRMRMSSPKRMHMIFSIAMRESKMHRQ
nr:MAG TPA: hypothetical protein [Caudoviricetes sp.]